MKTIIYFFIATQLLFADCGSSVKKNIEKIKQDSIAKADSIAMSLIAKDTSSFIDSRDGKTYKTIKIGTQTWMAENLDYGTNESWCYDDKKFMCSTYGKLYTWEDAKIACPFGWHLPSENEWTKLIDYLGGNETAGNEMKESGILHWESPNTGANNISGFRALPGGTTMSGGTFIYLGYTGFWWSSKELDKDSACCWALNYSTADVARYNYPKNWCFSVRCLADTIKKVKINSLDTLKVTDIDGNIYHTLKIGTQVWMEENLKVTHYRNGAAIPNVTDKDDWSKLSTGAYCNYDNNANYSATYGRLYNRYAINDKRFLCPTGWHVPTDAEWSILTTYLGGISVAGGKLKETGTTHWESPNIGATNNYFFSALPGGYRGNNGTFDLTGNFGYWWSTSDAVGAWVRELGFGMSAIGRYAYFEKEYGFSVRCIKN